MNTIEPDRIEMDFKSMHIAGLRQTFSSGLDVPVLWKQFNRQSKEIPDQISPVAYGLCINMGNRNKESSYMCGVEVSGIERLPQTFSHKQLPAKTYAVFTHEGHVSKLRQTLDATNRWLNRSDYKQDDTADFFFERYGEAFDPETGTNDIEVWIPVKKP